MARYKIVVEAPPGTEPWAVAELRVGEGYRLIAVNVAENEVKRPPTYSDLRHGRQLDELTGRLALLEAGLTAHRQHFESLRGGSQEDLGSLQRQINEAFTRLNQLHATVEGASIRSVLNQLAQHHNRLNNLQARYDNALNDLQRQLREKE